MRRLASFALLLSCCLWTVSLQAAPGKFPTFNDAAQAGPDYAAQGEYVGESKSKQKLGLQKIAKGDGKFEVVLYQGGLPGDGWDKSTPQRLAPDAEEVKYVTWTKVERQSPTLGAKPPEGAVVLFDGFSLDAFDGGHLGEGNLLLPGMKPENGETPAKRQDIKTKQAFGDCTIHIEFRTPFMPTATGQARGNSGVYLQNRYECQVLDSFGLSGEDNECGGFYKAAKPNVNMCLPPLAWQTYDIDFTAPKFDADGKKTANARVTVKHNGVAIHDNLELQGVTPGGEKTEAATGIWKFQDHGNPVCFRNMWVVEKK